MSSEHETWSTVHRAGPRGLRARLASKGHERSDVLQFSETSFVHQSEYDSITAEHVVPRPAKGAGSSKGSRLGSFGSRGGAKSFTGIWRNSALHHDVYSSREQVDLSALASAVVAYRTTGDDNPVRYLSFVDSHGGIMSLPVSPAFEESATWAPLLRDALDRAGVKVDDVVRDVLGAWCEGRPYSPSH